MLVYPTPLNHISVLPPPRVNMRFKGIIPKSHNLTMSSSVVRLESRTKEYITGLYGINCVSEGWSAFGDTSIVQDSLSIWNPPYVLWQAETYNRLDRENTVWWVRESRTFFSWQLWLHALLWLDQRGSLQRVLLQREHLLCWDLWICFTAII